jgi:cysteinyl-tRNA synthetase
VALRIFNTLTRREEEFRPIDDKKVKMYVCGVTVYDDIHMGHARSIIVFDMISRYLRFKGYGVTLVTNFTDVDDKIINRAIEMKMKPLELSAMYIEKYFQDIEKLGVKKADIYPKASECIPEIISMVQRIIDNGFGYKTEDGSVYFSVDKAAEYGKLSGNKQEEMISGARVCVDEIKANPMDFCLWKAAKPGEISWTSPWGQGRPGWHIECSAMCLKYLGETIDIHGGGNDLIFPHHENEILQSESVTGKPLAKYWLHNGMLQVQDAKMSKSMKNFFTVNDIAGLYKTQEIRFYLLNTHYRGPLNYSENALDEAAASLKRIQNTYAELKDHGPKAAGDYDAEDLVQKTRDEFIAHMDDDFNTRGAIAAIFEAAREANKLMDQGKLSRKGTEGIISLFQELDGILGILPSQAEKKVDHLDDVMQILIEVRKELRKRKAYDLADQIRTQLAAKGIVLEDNAEGVRWKQA